MNWEIQDKDGKAHASGDSELQAWCSLFNVEGQEFSFDVFEGYKKLREAKGYRAVQVAS